MLRSILGVFTVGILAILFYQSVFAFTPDSTPDTIPPYGTNGDVNDIIVDGNTLYVGGQFTHVGVPASSVALVSKSTNELALQLPYVDASISTAISDNAGGWYIGGGFEKVGGEDISYVAHILSDGTVDTGFDLEIDSGVSALALDGTTLYVGGEFNNVNGATTRNNLAAFDTTTGTATAFNPDVDGGINALILDGTTLYIGGGFGTVNGATTRNSLAALDTTTGIATAFDPNLDDNVTALIVDGTTLYVGGIFNDVNGGTTRNGLAAFNTATGIATAFDPNMDVTASVSSILINGTTLYVGGNFTTVNGGTLRNNLAAFDTGTGLATPFNPNIDAGVYTLLLDGTTLYVGGEFNNVNGGTDRNYIAAFDTTTGIATAFDPSFSGDIFDLVNAGSNILAVGSFNLINTVSRNRLAAFDLTTGLLTAFDPNLEGGSNPVTLLLDGTTLYVGSNFTTVNGATTRNGLAAFDTTTGVATAFNPNISGTAHSLLLDGTTLYVGGGFSTVNGATTRNGLAAFNTTTGVATAFNPDIGGGGSPTSLALDDTTLYVGGNFTTVNGGTTRNKLAAFDTTTGIATAFDPNLDSFVEALILDGTTLYVGGGFTTVNGATTRNGLAAFDTTTGIATAFDPDVDGSVYDLILDDTTLYVGGSFTNVNGGTVRNSLAVFDTGTGVVTTFNPNISDYVYSLFLTDTNLYAGGGIYAANNGSIPLRGLAIFNGTTPTPTPSSGGSSSSGSRPRNRVVAVAPTVPSPTPTACPAYLNSYIKKGAVNIEDDVKKLQTFLNQVLQTNLVVSGTYDNPTFDAVVKFQELHSTEVLAPWKLTKGSGWVYITTTKKINSEYCRLNPVS